MPHSVTRSQHISEATAQIIDEEIRRVIEEAEATAREVLTEHLDDLHTIAKGLLEYESLNAKDVQALLHGEPIDRTEESDAEGPSGRRSSVPSSGKAAKGPGKGATGGMEPEPQPGS